VAFACIFKTPLKKAPWAFYAGALVLVVLYVGRETFTFPVMVERPIFYLMQKCTFAEALFVVVMYIGVLGETSRIRAYLMPVRAELSIVACIIAFGHIIGYLMSFLPQVIGATASLRATILFSFCLALLLVLLLVVLGATSFNAVKRAMSLALWKRIQWLAYPFFLLTYVHLLLFLLPAALHGATPAQFSVVVYTVVFGGYLIARSVRMIQTRRTPHRAGRS
jgi:DMSO/TMAO reductase YedYZ heme-binding membrane subunit